MTCLESGRFENTKGLWHLGGLVFALGAATYNLAALVQRREAHLAVNAVAYTALVVWEAQKCVHHFHDGQE